jgi:hypothetical protein
VDEEQRILFERLRKELRLYPTDMEPIWQRLEEAGEIDVALREGAGEVDEALFMKSTWKKQAFQDLVRPAKETPEYTEIETKIERRPKRGRPPQEIKEHFEVPLAPLEEERAVTLSEAFALRAAEHREVKAFRQEVLGGLITSEQARAFVISPAVRSFERRRFEEWGIPPVGHEAKVVRTERDVDGFRWGPNFSDFLKFGFRPWIDRFVEVHVEPPGVTKSILYASYDVRVPEDLRVDERYFFESDEEDGFVRELPESVVRYPWEDRVREVKALPGSLLDKLLGLSSALASVYGWKQEDALWFVLTGETPQISPLELSASLLTGYDRSPPVWTVTLEVAPWVKVDTVASAFREIQLQILRGDSSKNKKTDKKLALFRFVIEQTKTHGKRPDLKTLFELWNEKYPEGHKWHYKKAKYPKRPWDSFRDALKDAEETIMRPSQYFTFPDAR